MNARATALTHTGPVPGSSSPSMILRRKCNCGAHTPGGGTCGKCAGKGDEPPSRIAIGPIDDPHEAEADRMVDAAMSADELPARLGSAQGSVSGVEFAPASVEGVLGSRGDPLEPALHREMESRFDHDFSAVRVHDNPAAARSAMDLSARAYTVGSNIAFAGGQFAPASVAGRQLLAHELAHVVQGSGNQDFALRREPTKQKAGRKAPKNAAPKKATAKGPEICGRPSRKVTGNEITNINLDVGANTLTIEWANTGNIPSDGKGPHKISPGAGKCCVNCDDDTVSQTSGSLCTPKGGSWKVSGKGCVLSGFPTARNPTYFQRSGVAIHTGNTTAPPMSHGCSRTKEEISQLIHDNAVTGKTEIASSGTWAGKNCYKTAAAKNPVARSSVCDGFKLKPPPPKPKKAAPAKPKKSAPKRQAATYFDSDATGQAFAAIEEMDSEAVDEVVAIERFEDGPGPNNEGGDVASLPVEAEPDALAFDDLDASATEEEFA